MPGTITTSWRRTQAAVRKMSTNLPRPFDAIEPSRDAVRYSARFQCRRVAGIPNRAVTASGPPHRASTRASGWSARR